MCVLWVLSFTELPNGTQETHLLCHYLILWISIPTPRSIGPHPEFLLKVSVNFPWLDWLAPFMSLCVAEGFLLRCWLFFYLFCFVFLLLFMLCASQSHQELGGLLNLIIIYFLHFIIIHYENAYKPIIFFMCPIIAFSFQWCLWKGGVCTIQRTTLGGKMIHSSWFCPFIRFPWKVTMPGKLSNEVEWF